MKPFFKWLRQTTDDPPEIKGLKSKKGSDDDIPADQLISREDLALLLQALPDAQDKAKVAVLYDSGLRASEFCALNVGSVVFDKYGAVITLPKGAPGLKTGARRVRVFGSLIQASCGSPCLESERSCDLVAKPAARGGRCRAVRLDSPPVAVAKQELAEWPCGERGPPSLHRRQPPRRRGRKGRRRRTLMRTRARMFGMVTLAFARGEGSEQRSPMGQAVIGGVITSSLLTLVVVPVVYCYMDDLAQWLRRRWGPPASGAR